MGPVVYFKHDFQQATPGKQLRPDLPGIVSFCDLPPVMLDTRLHPDPQNIVSLRAPLPAKLGRQPRPDRSVRDFVRLLLSII